MSEHKIDVMWDDAPVDVSTEVGFIWSIANKLRGTYQSDKYKDVIIPMVIIRRFECALEATKQAVVEQYNRDLAAWERQVREKQKPAQKEQAKPPERESLLKRLRQLQAEGKQRNQPRQRKKSFDRDSR